MSSRSGPHGVWRNASRVLETDEGGRGVDTGLYLHGLAEGDFELALRGLSVRGRRFEGFDPQAPVWSSEFEMWAKRSLADEVVYVWADGIYVKAGLERAGQDS